MNTIRKLRESLHWNQARLAQAIGRSWQSVQNYEAGKRVPRDVIEKLKAIAMQHGLADIAMELSSDEWQVRRVFHPGETLISETRRQLESERESCHKTLDEILDSGDSEAITAVRSHIVLLGKYVRLSRPRNLARRKK